jgi:opacity protein-like surface antigen
VKTLKKPLAIFTTLILLSTAQFSAAANFYGGLSLGLSEAELDEIDINDNSDDNPSPTVGLSGGYQFNQNWAIETGIKLYDDIELDSQQDSVSRYQITYSRKDAYLSGVFQFKPQGFIPIRLAAGITYSDVELKVKESFFGLAPSGKASADDSDLGFYLMAGIKPFNFKHVSSTIAAEYIQRQEMFSNSTKPLNSSEFMLTFTVHLH